MLEDRRYPGVATPLGAVEDRRVPDAHPRHIGDRVQWANTQSAGIEAEVA